MIPRTKIENISLDLAIALGSDDAKPIESFREALAVRFSLERPVLTSCASAGFYFALKALPGKKIYLPAYTCRAMFEACYFAERLDDVVLLDIDLDTYGMDLDALDKNIAPGSIIVATHQFGIPADMKRFQEIAKRTGGILIEDNAAAFGARIAGQETGTFGDVSLFSFDATKTFSACGGGAVFFRDTILQRAVEEIVKRELDTGRFLGAASLAKGILYNLATQEAIYGNVTYPLWTYRNGPYQDHGQLRQDRLAIYRQPFGTARAQMALKTLGRIDAVLGRRKEIEAAYLAKLNGHPSLATYHPLPGSETSINLFPVRITQGNKEAFYERGLAKGVDLGFTFSYVNRQGRPVGSLSNAESAAQQVLNLPFYSKLTNQQVDVILKTILEMNA